MFETDQNRLGLALLAAAGPSATPASFGQRLFAGMGQHDAYLRDKEEREQRRKQIEAQQAMQQMQMMQMVQAQAKAKREEEKAIQAELAAAALKDRQGAFLGGGMGMRTTPQQALAGGGGPSLANAEKVGAPREFDYATAIQLFGIENAQKMAAAQDWGRSKVTRSTKEIGPDGREYEYQLDEFGRKVGPGGAQYRTPITVNQGNQTALVDPYNLKTIQAFQQFQSPDSVASNAVSMRGQNMTDARAREGNAISMQNGKIPPGYRMKQDGTLEAIPGGPADIKAGELGAKAEARKLSATAQAESVLGTIKEAKALVGFTTAGLGGLSASIPATSARNLQAKLATIKANLGFDRLQEMRDQSPTGGALGQVAVQELTSLQSTVASLDQLQSPAELSAALDKAARHYERWQQTLGGSKGGATGNWDDLGGGFKLKK